MMTPSVKPYYSDDSVCIYHGDCRDILPQLEPVDLVLTDPPYPKLKGGLNVTLDRGVGSRFVTNKTVGTPWGDDISGVRQAWELCKFGLLSFCSFHSVRDVPGVVGADPLALVTWYQRNAMPSINSVPQYQTEFIWAFKKASGLDWRKLRTHYDIPRLQAGCMATERFVSGGSVLHPAQKPLKLMSALLAVGGESVLDPYCGTGTTLLAAKDLGRKAIGIEIEEKYCEIAARRMSQEVLAL